MKRLALVLTLLLMASTAAANDYIIENSGGSDLLIVNGTTDDVHIPTGNLDLEGGTLQNANLQSQSVDEGEINQNTLDDSEIQDNSLTASSLADGSVNTGEIADGQVQESDLASNFIDDTEIQDNSLSASSLASGSVGNSEINNGGSFTFGSITNNGQLDMQSNDIIDLQDPDNPQEAATKNYVDNQVSSGTTTATQTLSEVLSEGTSAGSYDINMNNNNIDDIASLDGGGDAVQIEDSATINDQGAAEVGLFIQDPTTNTDYGGRLYFNDGDSTLRLRTKDGGSENSGLSIKRNNGNIGIHTTNPQRTLDVNGDARIRGNLDIWGQITNTQVSTLNIDGSLVPPSGYSGTFDIGNSSRRWRNADFSGNINVGGNVDGIDVSNPGNAITTSGNQYAVASNSINDNEVADNSLSASSLASGSVDTSELASNSVTDTQIANGGTFSFNRVDVNGVSGSASTDGSVGIGAPTVYTNMIEAQNEKGGSSAYIELGSGGYHGSVGSDEIAFVTQGEVQSKVDSSGNLDLSSNSLIGVGGTQCSDNEFIDGSGQCETVSSAGGTDDQTLAEVLNQGSTANQAINMNGNNINGGGNFDITSISELNSDGSNLHLQHVTSSSRVEIGADSGSVTTDFNGNAIVNTGGFDYSSANDLDGSGNINDFSAASDLTSAGDISSFDNANDLDSSGNINDFSEANDLDSGGNLQSGSVSDNEISDNTVDNSEIQNSASFTFGGITSNGNLNMNGNAITLGASSNANPPVAAIKDTGYVSLENQEDQDLPTNNQFTLFADHSEGLQYNDNNHNDYVIASQTWVNNNDANNHDDQNLGYSNDNAPTGSYATHTVTISEGSNTAIRDYYDPDNQNLGSVLNNNNAANQDINMNGYEINNVHKLNGPHQTLRLDENTGWAELVDDTGSRTDLVAKRVYFDGGMGWVNTCADVTGGGGLCDGTDNTADGDTSSSNEYQDLSYTNDNAPTGSSVTHSVNIGNGANIDIRDYYEADTTIPDDQTLSTTADISGTNDQITISNGNSITIDDDYEADTNTQLDDVAATGTVDISDEHITNVKEIELQDWDSDAGGSDNSVRLLRRDDNWMFYNGGFVVGSYSDGTLGDIGDGNMRIEGTLTVDGGTECAADEALLGDGSCGSTGTAANKDLVAGSGLSGGANDVLPGSDSDVTISLNANDLDSSGNINDFSAASDLNSNGDVVADYINLNNIESVSDGQLGRDNSIGYLGNWGGNGNAVLWDAYNVQEGNAISITGGTGNEDNPQIAVNEGGLDCSAITGSSGLCDGTDNTGANDHDDQNLGYNNLNAPTGNYVNHEITISEGSNTNIRDYYDPNTDNQGIDSVLNNDNLISDTNNLRIGETTTTTPGDQHFIRLTSSSGSIPVAGWRQDGDADVHFDVNTNFPGPNWQSAFEIDRDTADLDMNGNSIKNVGSLSMGGDLDMNGNNITNNAGGNITFGKSIKVHGAVYVEDAGSGGGGPTLSDVLSSGNDMDGNTITDSDGNVTIGSDLQVQGGKVWVDNADLAEYYESSQQLEDGELVKISSSEDDSVSRTEKAYGPVEGIVSTNPGYVLNSNSTGYPIALTGKVPVKVSEENGEIERGDRIVPSSKSGVAMTCEIESLDETEGFKEYKKVSEDNRKCRDSTIGKALENSNGKSKILVKVSG